MDQGLIYEILSAVAEIPEGRVATYGQIARVLRDAALYGDYPCHRVVNHAGRLAPGFRDQAALLAAEGVPLTDSGRVDLRQYQWEE